VFFVDSFKFFLSLYGHKLPVLCMDISSDGTLLVSGSADKNIKAGAAAAADVTPRYPLLLVAAASPLTRTRALPSLAAPLPRCCCRPSPRPSLLSRRSGASTSETVTSRCLRTATR
jgi:hypothetical protein